MIFFIKNGISIYDWSIRAGAILVALIGAVEVASWLSHATSFALWPASLSTRLGSGGGFLAAAGALWLLQTSAPDSPPFRLGHALAVLSAMIGGATLAQDLSGFLGISQLMRGDAAVVETLQPRHVPLAEFSFLFAGTALFVLKSRDPRVAACCQWLAVPPLLFSLLGLVGHAYGVDVLSRTMAPDVASGIFVLTLATLAADSTHGFVQILVSDSAGGGASRRLLASVPVALFLLGWAQVRGEVAGLYGAQFGAVATAVIGIAVSVAAIVLTAIALHRADLVRKEAMARIRDLNARHERQVEERTEQLAQSLHKLNEANRQLERLSQYDGLTGIANRRYFDSYLENQIAVARRHNRLVSLILCDVDAFKAYNDHYGHQAGDQCLKQVAGAIQTCCRRTADIAARYGGEEFAIVLPETGLRGALRVAEAVREAVASLKIPHDHSPAGSFVSISGGIAATTWEGEGTAQQLIASADRMLYEAKRQGRNRIVAPQPVAA